MTNPDIPANMVPGLLADDDHAGILVRAAEQAELAASVHRTAQRDGLTDDTSVADWAEKQARTFRLVAAMLSAAPKPVSAEQSEVERVAKAHEIAAEAWARLRPVGGLFWSELPDSMKTLAIVSARDGLGAALPAAQPSPDMGLREALEKILGEVEPAKRYAESYGLQGGALPSAVHIKLDMIAGYARAALAQSSTLVREEG